MSNELNHNLKRPGTWQRILYMLLFGFIIGIVRILLWVVILFQVATHLLTGSPNPHAVRFGKKLAIYLYRILLFLSYNTDATPFPFAEWPDADEAP